MPDDWTMPPQEPGSPLPPLTNPADADPKSSDWQKAIGKAISDRQKLQPISPNFRYIVTATTSVSDAYLPVSGDNPGPWKQIGRKDNGNKDYILWQRFYPKVKMQYYKVITVSFTQIKKPPISALDPDKILESDPLPPPLVFWVKQGQPRGWGNASFYKWEESSVHRTGLDGKQTYIEIATPPNDDPDFPGVPTPDGRWGDPKKELQFTRAEFRDDGVLLAIGLMVRDAQGHPIEGARIALEGEELGITGQNGGLEAERFFPRPSDSFGSPPGNRPAQQGAAGGRGANPEGAARPRR